MSGIDDEMNPVSQRSDSRGTRRARTWRSLNRFEAFPDGVFAIVTTILIFNLTVPESPDGLLAQLRDQLPSLLPFTTSLSTAHMLDPGRRVAAVAFALNLGLSALMGAILVSCIARTHGLTHASDLAELRWLERQRWIGVALLAVSFVISALLPKAAVVADIAAVLLLIVQTQRGMRRFGGVGARAGGHPRARIVAKRREVVLLVPIGDDRGRPGVSRARSAAGPPR